MEGPARDFQEIELIHLMTAFDDNGHRRTQDAPLIQFSRAQRSQQRESRYRIAEVSDAIAAMPVLADALGVCVRVSSSGREGSSRY